MDNAIQEAILKRLEKLREPFPSHQISKLPKPTSRDAKKGRCPECGGWHGLPAVHLDYVGHAALTDRLLDVDPAWHWEPFALDERGMPAIDKDGGMWIKLTICGVTRLGYGDAQGKTGGDAMKERIGDALRNAGMRFGMALDLWHKGILHLDEEPAPEPEKKQNKIKPEPSTDAALIATHISAMEACTSLESLRGAFSEAWKATHGAPAIKGAYDQFKNTLETTPQ